MYDPKIDFEIEDLFEDMEEEFTKKEPPVSDESLIKKPFHYNQAGIECIEAIRAATDSGFEYYLQGNIMKYVWRYRYKNGKEDLKKAQVYLGWLIDNYKDKQK